MGKLRQARFIRCLLLFAIVWKDLTGRDKKIARAGVFLYRTILQQASAPHTYLVVEHIHMSQRTLSR
jgi:hypothetical protein